MIEACAQSHGARIHGQSMGSFGDVAAWSFCQDKIPTIAGESAMVNTTRAHLWDAMWAFKDHGKTHEAVYGRPPPRLSLAARAFRLQLPPHRTAERHRSHPAPVPARVDRSPLPQRPAFAEALRDLPAVRVPLPPDGLTHAWYKFYAFVKPDALAEGWSRDRILSEIAALGYPALSGSCSEIYLEHCFQDAGLAPAERLPVARELSNTSLMFLVHPTITPEQMAGYAEAVRSVVKRAYR